MKYLNNRIINLLPIVCFLFLISGSVQSSGNYFTTPAYAGFLDDELEIFEEAIDFVGKEHVYPPDYKKLYSGAIQEMIRTIKSEKLQTRPIFSGQLLKIDNDKISYTLSYNPKSNMKAFRLVYHFLAKHFSKSISKKELEEASIIGLMNSLDPYSSYLSQADYENTMRDTEGQYGGVGMVITLEDYKLTVVRVLKNSPAERAGILPQDVITQVDGQKIKGMQIQELASKLRGYPNTEVVVNVFRPTTKITSTHTLTREIISIEAVTYKNLGHDTGYIKISSFSKQTNEQLLEALEKGKEQHVKGFILDLRGNPGGLLSQSVKVASQFLKKGDLIVSTRGRQEYDRQTYQASYSNSLYNMPLVIIINHHSASASEIVAGSLKDSGKALIIGENSYGKGSVQTIFRMSDGAGLRLTTSKYYTPSGIDITAHGITPAVKIIQDLPEIESKIKSSSKNKSDRTTHTENQIQVKESEIKGFLKKESGTKEKSSDLWISFAKLILEKSSNATRSRTLAKAKEIAKGIHHY